MNTTTYQPNLGDAEWDIIIELLEHERHELPAEIHHTDASEVREQLHRRLELIDNLLQRLRPPSPESRQVERPTEASSTPPPAR